MNTKQSPHRFPKAEIRKHTGVPTLFINGVPNAGMSYMTYHAQKKHYAAFGEKGIDLASLSVSADYAVHFGQPNAWLGPDVYDFSDTDEKMALILEANPDAYIFPRVYMCSPPWWDEQHPDELVKWDDGTTERTIGRKHKFPSWSSEPYREASAKTLRHFIEHVRRQPYADRVIGYHIVSGMWEEWFYWSTTGASDGQSDLGDYSAPAQRGFRAWLERKYGSDASLQAAWHHSSITLENATIPGKAERQATDLFVWRDPAIRANVIDYYLFTCESVTEIIERLARTAKEATRGEQLVGVFYGYMFYAYADNWMQDNGHLALRKLLNCEHIDFLAAPSCYAFRQFDIGYSTGQNATDAIRLHGKYYMNENDYHTHLVANQEDYRRVSTLEDSRAVQCRELGSMITRGWGGWWFDMQGGWYDDPQFMKVIEKLNGIAEQSIHFDRSDCSDIAVVIDEASIFCTGLKKTLMLPLMYEQTLPLGRMGAPFDWVFLDDLEKAKPYAFYIFLNAFQVNDNQKIAIEGLRQRGAKAFLWFYGAGFASKQSLDVQGCTDLTGITIRRIEKAGPLVVELTQTGAQSLGMTGDVVRYGTGNDIGPLLYPDDPEVTVLGTMADYDLPGLVVKRVNDIDAYYSAAPTLPGSILRAMARSAGVHIYSDLDDVLYVNASFLCIYAAKAGVRNIHLPRRTDVFDLYNGLTVANNIIDLKIELPAKHTALYFLGSEIEWRASRSRPPM
ncbi:MAG: beta-galactosidase [Verrucomicrobia bacterium]|nr:beta-galactosidase [Verrucomicrobiota bacterium]